MVTKHGIIKKTSVDDFENIRRSGLIAIKLEKGDELRWVGETSGEDEIVLVAKKGQSIRFSEKDVRSMGRTAQGVRGIRLKNDEVVGLGIIPNAKRKAPSEKQTGQEILIIAENGFGKRTPLTQFRKQGRGGSGIKAMTVTKKTGEIRAAHILDEAEELIVISEKGQVIRTPISSISQVGRAAQGVRVMRLDEGDHVASSAVI
jgi:DNA gyrase subunit A